MKEGQLSNYIPINRRYFDHRFWQEERIYSKAEAWLDILQQARFEVSQGKLLIGMKMIMWNRGELVASVRFLADRWGWGNGKVLRYLELLEQDEMITRRQEFGQTIITICNYDTYNGGKVTTERRTEQKRNTGRNGLNAIQDSITGEDRNTERNAERNGNENKAGTGPEQQRNETNKDNIVNKEEEVKPAAPAPIYTPDQENSFKKFQEWIGANAPQVARMVEPFTIDQYLSVAVKYKSQDIRALLAQMHNWKDLCKKNRSAYYTLMNWKRREEGK